MSSRRLLALATVCALAAFLVLVLRVAHPHHRQLALAIYGLGWVPFVLSIRKARGEYSEEVAKLRAWRGHILVGLAVLFLGWAVWVLIPVEPSPLLEVDEELLPATLDADLLASYDSRFLRYLAAPVDRERYKALTDDPARRRFIEDWWARVAENRQATQRILVDVN